MIEPEPDYRSDDDESTPRRRSILDPKESFKLEDGYWPSWWKKYLNDWVNAEKAKPRDGIVPPELQDPLWLDRAGASSRLLLDAARLRHDQAEARIGAVEQRAARLTQTALALMTLAVVAAGFIADRLRILDPHPVWWTLASLIAVAPIVLFGMSLLHSLGIDRVSLVHPPDPGLATAFDEESQQRRNLIGQEIRAAEIANWTAGKKVNEFLQARAWLTRAATMLLVSGVVAGGFRSFVG